MVSLVGVVEDRDDPDKLGRVRVRCVGYHTDDVNKIPTQTCWSWVMMPTTTSSMGGLEGIRLYRCCSWVSVSFVTQIQMHPINQLLSEH